MKHLPSFFVLTTAIATNGRVFTMKSGGIASAFDTQSGSPLFQAERVEASGDYYARLSASFY